MTKAVEDQSDMDNHGTINKLSEFSSSDTSNNYTAIDNR